MPIFHKVFRELYGEPCWNVQPGYGSFLTLEFGKPHLDVHEPIVASKDAPRKVRRLLARRNIFVHGEWHLRIASSAWEVLSNGKHVGNGSTKLSMRRAADLLNGQKLIQFSFRPEESWSVFEFDLGATLRTVPYDRKSEQWVLHTPKQKTLTLRADRRYQYMRADLPRDRGQWKPALR
ncbi:MAG TPA: hypothetical protein VKF84_11360 [Candidatus Sulfotelmatobacter sp.]|nr:hypothetical protein [Candidatus Sulfotelmatobacter sp.]